jgi:hypothetical protein
VELPDLDDEPVREELYDLSRDPLERQDLSADSPEQLASMRAVLRDYLDSAKLSSAGERSAGRESAPEFSAETLERLRALGYRQAE